MVINRNHLAFDLDAVTELLLIHNVWRDIESSEWEQNVRTWQDVIEYQVKFPSIYN